MASPLPAVVVDMLGRQPFPGTWDLHAPGACQLLPLAAPDALLGALIPAPLGFPASPAPFPLQPHLAVSLLYPGAGAVGYPVSDLVAAAVGHRQRPEGCMEVPPAAPAAVPPSQSPAQRHAPAPVPALSGGEAGSDGAGAPLKKRIRFIQPVSASWEHEAQAGEQMPIPTANKAAGCGACSTKGEPAMAVPPCVGLAPAQQQQAEGSSHVKRKRVEFVDKQQLRLPPLPASSFPIASALLTLQQQQQAQQLQAAAEPCQPSATAGLLNPVLLALQQQQLSHVQSGLVPAVTSSLQATIPPPAATLPVPPAASVLPAVHPVVPVKQTDSNSLSLGSHGSAEGKMATVQQQLGLLYHNFVSARDVYLHQAVCLIESMNKPPSKEAIARPPEVKAKERAAVQRALDKAMEIINANASASAALAQAQAAQKGTALSAF